MLEQKKKKRKSKSQIDELKIGKRKIWSIQWGDRKNNALKQLFTQAEEINASRLSFQT